LNVHYFYLAIAIVSEVIATASLKAADGFRSALPSALVVIGYGSAFYFMSLTLRAIPVGVTYAIWSGVGIALISLAGWILYKQPLDLPAVIGISLIVAGVVVMSLFSNSLPR
jgi:small multidrug resistance pump